MKRSLVLSLVLVLVLLLGACAPAATADNGGTAAAKPIKIGVANFSQCCPYFIGMNDSIIAEAGLYSNVTIISTNADGDATKFQSDIEDLISQGVDGVIISGAWLEQAPAALDALKTAKVPTVLVDRLFTQGAADAYTAYIGPDNLTIGVQDGQYIADRLNGEGVVVELRGGPADNSIGLNRSNGVQQCPFQISGHHRCGSPRFRRLECRWRHKTDGKFAGCQPEDRRSFLRE